MDKIFKRMKAKPKEWIPEQAATILMDIIQASSEQLWDGEELTPWDYIAALTAAALEARDPNMSGIQFSPHFILHGSAGKGKTLLGQLLFPLDIASGMTNDS